MKTKNILTCATCVFSVATLMSMTVPLMAQTVIVRPPSVSIQIPVPPPPAVVITPVVDVVPDYYVWDGVEYVGVVGNTYVYLGPDHVWCPLPSARLVFFHDWERDHHEWREHAIENTRYRRDAHGHDHPWTGHAHDAHDAGHHDGGHVDHHDSDHHDHDHGGH